MVHISAVWPFPSEALRELMEGAQQFIVVESNATGQMAHLIRAETGLEASRKILTYDGRPITPTYIVNKFYGEVKG